jgi:ABC-2 type transport system permease protein
MSIQENKPSPAPSPEQALHRLFLTLFLRGRTSRGLQRKGAPRSVFAKLWGMLILYCVVGCMAFAFFRQSTFVFSLSLHAMTFFILGSFIAGSTGEVLFNKEEADILMHRPVTAKALLWAKMSVLMKVSIWLAGAFNLVTLFIGIKISPGGWLFPVAHLISMAMNALFCTGLVVVVYQLCLRWFGRERLDGLMTGAQVFMGIAIAAGSQIVPRMIRYNGGKLGLIQGKWWIYLLPPAWFAGFDDALAGNGTGTSLLLAALGVTSTGLVVWLAFIKLARDYERGLQTINESTAPRKQTGGRRQWLDVLVHSVPMRWWLRDSVARASFLLSAAYLLRDRDVKLRIYPGLAPMMAMPIVFLFQRSDFGVAFAGAYIGFIPMQALSMLQFSQHWQAADLFRAAPIPGPIQLCHGARRAVLVMLTAPAVLLILLIANFIGGSSGLLMLLPGILALPLYALLPSLGGKAVPLSQATEEGKRAGKNVLLMLVVTMVSAIIAGLAQWSSSAGWFFKFITVEVIVLAFLYIGIRMIIARTTWESME